jgi:hypothetical protein
MFFSDAVRLPLIVNEVGMSTVLAVEVAKLANTFGKGDASTLLLK